MEREVDDSFVSISLEPCESCGLCGLDTGEQLVSSCQLCVRKSTQVPFQKGFNQMPKVPHAGIVAHESCLGRSHQLLKQQKHRFHSPLLHQRGMSVPNDVSSSGLYDTVGDKLLWVINYAKNESLKNKQNHLQVHSSPCTRSSSPDIFKALTEEALMRRNSENNLKGASFMELRKSYAKYLYGSKITKSHSDDNVGWKSRSNPNLGIDDADSGKPEIQPLQLDTKVPGLGSAKGRPQLSPTILHVVENNNTTNLSKSLKPSSPTIPDVLIEDQNEPTESDRQLWSNKQKMDKEQLNKMTAAEIENVVSSLENRIKDISAELVDLLQDRDDLGQEVRSRNLTIQKLVKMKHSQQDMPVKTTGVGNI